MREKGGERKGRERIEKGRERTKKRERRDIKEKLGALFFPFCCVSPFFFSVPARL